MDELPIQEIASLPLKYSRKLYYTLFAREYLEERMNYTFDALNLLYVATTRAKEELHIWLPTSTDGKKKEKNEPLSNIPKDIKALLMEEADGKPLWQGLPAEVISEEKGASEEKYPKLIQRQAIPTSRQENILQVNSISNHCY